MIVVFHNRAKLASVKIGAVKIFDRKMGAIDFRLQDSFFYAKINKMLLVCWNI